MARPLKPGDRVARTRFSRSKGGWVVNVDVTFHTQTISYASEVEAIGHQLLERRAFVARMPQPLPPDPVEAVPGVPVVESPAVPEGTVAFVELAPVPADLRLVPCEVRLRWTEGEGRGEVVHVGPRTFTVQTGPGSTEWHFARAGLDWCPPSRILPLPRRLLDGSMVRVGPHLYVTPELVKYVRDQGRDGQGPDRYDLGWPPPMEHGPTHEMGDRPPGESDRPAGWTPPPTTSPRRLEGRPFGQSISTRPTRQAVEMMGNPDNGGAEDAYTIDVIALLMRDGYEYSDVMKALETLESLDAEPLPKGADYTIESIRAALGAAGVEGAATSRWPKDWREA